MRFQSNIVRSVERRKGGMGQRREKEERKEGEGEGRGEEREREREEVGKEDRSRQFATIFCSRERTTGGRVSTCIN